MSMKLQGSHNLFTSFLKNERHVIAVGLNIPESCHRFNQFWEFMDKSQYINESIRTAMLKQEKIFREQVHELHRLYRVQKLLMAESSDKYAKWHEISDATMKVLADSSARLQSSFSTFGTSHSSHYSNTRLDLISQELNISFKDKRVQKGLNCCSDGENDVDLTLSIGRGADQKKTKHKLN